MKNKQLGIWVGTEDLNNDPAFAVEAEKEFKHDPTTSDQKEDNSFESNRRAVSYTHLTLPTKA